MKTNKRIHKAAAKSGAKVLGVTRDGVKILKPKKPTSFTHGELRAAIATVRARRGQ